MEIGGYIMEGLAIGITDGSDNVNLTVVKTVDDMVDTMVTSLSAVPSAIESAMDLNPVISPVLDLSAIQQGAATMGDMLNVIPITAAASYGQASTIAAGQNTIQSDLDAVAAPGSTQVIFNQTNNSPEALSPAEVYRQTKNQLSQAKAVIG